MRDVSFIVWAAIVFIGMVASIVSTARKAAVSPRPVSVRPPPQATVPQWTAAPAPQPTVAPAPPRPSVPPGQRPLRMAHPGEHDFPAALARPKTPFGNRASLRRAVIAAEVLGKPLALRDE